MKTAAQENREWLNNPNPGEVRCTITPACRDCGHTVSAETFWSNGTRYCFDINACSTRRRAL